MALPTAKTTFQAGSHLVFNLFDKSFMKLFFASEPGVVKAVLILLPRPFQIYVITVLFSPEPVPCHFRPWRGWASSMAIRMIAKLVFEFIN